MHRKRSTVGLLFLLRFFCSALQTDQKQSQLSPLIGDHPWPFIRRWAAIFLIDGNGIFFCKWSPDWLLLWLGLIFIGRQMADVNKPRAVNETS